jgi:hypothetical protein
MRSSCHTPAVTQTPGHYPDGPATVAVLLEAGADVNARFTGPHTETPLHWAASSDDVLVLDALLEHGTSKPPERSSPAEHRSMMRSPSPNGSAPGGWSNVALGSASSTPPRSACSTAYATTPLTARPKPTSPGRSGPPATADNTPPPSIYSTWVRIATGPHRGTGSHPSTQPGATASTNSPNGSLATAAKAQRQADKATAS